MHYIACLFVCLIITPYTTGHGMSSSSSASNCSSFTASSNTLPMMLLNLKNLTGELQLGEDSTIRKQSAETRTFVVRCMAPYPVRMGIHFYLKNRIDKMEQVVDNQVPKYPNPTGLFVAITFIHFRSGEEPMFNTSCASSCDPTQFPFRVTLSTIQDPTDEDKLRVGMASVRQSDTRMKKVQSTTDGERNVKFWAEIIMWTRVLIKVIVIILFCALAHNMISQRQLQMRVHQEPQQFEMQVAFR